MQPSHRLSSSKRPQKSKQSMKPLGINGRVFTPPSIPRAFSAPRPLHTIVEYNETTTSTLASKNSINLFAALSKQYGFRADNSSATTSYGIQVKSLIGYLIPNTNDSALGWVEVQIMDPLGFLTEEAVLRNIKTYGGLSRMASFGYVYPKAAQAKILDSSEDATLLKIRHDDRSAGAQTIMLRFTLNVIFFGGNVLDPE